MPYSEHHFSNSFCAPILREFQADILAGVSYNLVAMPGVGVTYLLRALIQKTDADFVSINSYEMPNFSRRAFYEQLAQKLDVIDAADANLADIHASLVERTKADKQIVLICNRIDRLAGILDQNFYDNLRYLRDAGRGKISIIFVSSKPLSELNPHPISDMLSLVAKTSYFSGYNNKDLLEVYRSGGQINVDPAAIQYAGGHHLLLQILSHCQNLHKPLSDPMVELVIKDIYAGLNSKQHKMIEAAIAKNIEPEDPYLMGVGFLKRNEGALTTFTPLLAEYTASLGKQYLPLKEKRLLKILMLHTGKIVSKEVICNYVWSEDNGISSDWALNALIYRLRRHPAFDSQRYSIESRKGEGYVLVDHSQI